MRKIIEFILANLVRVSLWFRYRVKVQGLEKLTPEALNKPGGILFLPNHSSVFVDPSLIALAVRSKFPIRPMIVEHMYYTPVINYFMRLMDALPIPDFEVSSNSLKRKRSEKVIQQVIQGLKARQNFLIYPAGKTKSSSLEIIGGNSGVHGILEQAPDVNVVLVRLKGLWGSSFSRALTGKSPLIFPTIWQGVKIALKNFLFFTPKRDIIIEFVPAPPDFPYHASRLELNKYLEAWYNRPDGLTVQKGNSPGDSLVLVSYSFWKESYMDVGNRKDLPDENIDIRTIPQATQEMVTKKLAEMTEKDPSSIKPEMSLSADLGLDSLDAAELTAFLQDQFDVSTVPVNELTSVAKLMALAAKKIVCREEVEEVSASLKKWKKAVPHNKAQIAEGETIPEVFLNSCKKMGNIPACGDMMAGVLTYDQLKLRAILLAEYIRHLPGDYIGILLPSSVAANVLILATLLAKKIPLMINWTVGSRYLESVVQLSNVEVVLSSWAFLDRLENVNFDAIEDKIVMLEDVRHKLGILDKFKAYWRSKQSTKSILKLFNIDGVTKDDQAVLLFTSGTESLPKGVPLSHNNILSNQRSLLEVVELFTDDIVLAILPPFHAFGFTITGLLGLLGGVKVAFSPDPTDGKRLAKAFEHWGATILCGAPTFIKTLLKSAHPGQLETLRLCATGAEKAPPELFSLVEQLGKKECLIEGYGITECSPALTFNPLGEPRKGVGRALPNVELCIVHPETFEAVPKGTQGLILARGPNVFSRYLNPGISSPFVTVEGKSWYKTGDLGFLDDKGNLTLSGRMKRFIKIGPEMISLASIEDVLSQVALKNGWPTTEEGPALAVCAKEIDGEKAKIVVFTKFQATSDELNKSLREFGFSNLVKISSVMHLAAIPVMGTGKINYRALENLFQ